MPEWRNKLRLGDVFYVESIPIKEKAAIIAERILKAPWADEEVRDLAEELKTIKDANEFDDIWASIYDWADYDHRLWIDLWGKKFGATA